MVNGFALFLDEVTWIVEGVPSLRVLNIIVNILFYTAGPMLTYQFWQYVSRALKLDSPAMRKASGAIRVLLTPATLVCWLNLFVPIYFSVDEQGVYQRGSLYPLSFAYLVFVIVIMIVGLASSNAPKQQKRIVITFVTLPILNILLTFRTYGLSTQYVATLVSIVLVYSVLFADQSNLLASTATELNMAAGIQANMLPNLFPAFPTRKEFDIYATMDPAKEVGGDFYDFFMIGENHLGMVVADVSGKGVPAALFSMIAKTMLKTQAQTRLSPKRVLLEVNASLSENNEEDMFVTVWLGVLEISTGELTYADAGHEKLLLYQNGEWKFLPKSGGVALAMWEPEDLELMDAKYQFHNETIQLNPGDAIFQYTDGVTEATDAGNELFGDDRLLAAVNSAPSATPEELLPYVRGKIDEFVKEAPQFDDITMLGLQYRGTN